MEKCKMEQYAADFEKKANELTLLMFILCEECLVMVDGIPTREYTALTSAALSLQNSITAFLAIERFCD